MKSLKRQRGISSLGWLAILMASGFFLMCGFKVIPLYADNIYMKNSLKSLSQLENPEGGFEGVTNGEIKAQLNNFNMVNNIRNPEANNIKIERFKNKFLVNLNYERRVPLFYNIEVVTTFKNQFDSSRPHECCTPASE
ncbi:MAG: DUF4845 domain-containing protein [Cellvibrionaceae bacterium]